MSSLFAIVVDAATAQLNPGGPTSAQKLVPTPPKNAVTSARWFKLSSAVKNYPTFRFNPQKLCAPSALTIGRSIVIFPQSSRPTMTQSPSLTTSGRCPNFLLSRGGFAIWREYPRLKFQPLPLCQNKRKCLNLSATLSMRSCQTCRASSAAQVFMCDVCLVFAPRKYYLR